MNIWGRPAPVPFYLYGGVARLMHQTRSAPKENLNGDLKNPDHEKIFGFGALRAGARKRAARLGAKGRIAGSTRGGAI